MKAPTNVDESFFRAKLGIPLRIPMSAERLLARASTLTHWSTCMEEATAVGSAIPIPLPPEPALAKPPGGGVSHGSSHGIVVQSSTVLRPPPRLPSAQLIAQTASDERQHSASGAACFDRNGIWVRADDSIDCRTGMWRPRLAVRRQTQSPRAASAAQQKAPLKVAAPPAVLRATSTPRARKSTTDERPCRPTAGLDLSRRKAEASIATPRGEAQEADVAEVVRPAVAWLYQWTSWQLSTEAALLDGGQWDDHHKALTHNCRDVGLQLRAESQVAGALW